MSTDEAYNGWANRETWAAALHINNDQGWQESVREALREADVTQWNEQPAGGLHAHYAGKVVREHVEEMFDPDTHDGIFPRDIILAMQDIGSLWRVDWSELGAAFLADIAEEDQ